MFYLITGNVIRDSIHSFEFSYLFAFALNIFFFLSFDSNTFLLQSFIVFRRFQRVISNPGHPWIKFPRTPLSSIEGGHFSIEWSRHCLTSAREKREKRREGRDKLDAEMRIRSAPEDWRVARRKLVAIRHNKESSGEGSCILSLD